MTLSTLVCWYRDPLLARLQNGRRVSVLSGGQGVVVVHVVVFTFYTQDTGKRIPMGGLRWYEFGKFAFVTCQLCAHCVQIEGNFTTKLVIMILCRLQIMI
jgi:hypothetical protein